jgi:hypothetical protein
MMAAGYFACSRPPVHAGFAFVRNHLRKLLGIVCALSLSGAHWALLQTAAWTGMLVTRTQTTSVAEAVSSTFDGEHPCTLCTAISHGQEQEQKQPAAPVLKKADELKLVAMPAMVFPPPRMGADIVWPDFIARADSRTEQPPTPPPLA